MIKNPKALLCLLFIISISNDLASQVKLGDIAPDFSLSDVNGKTVSLSDYGASKGIVIIFTSNTCPFAIAYEQRIIKLHKNYASYGYPILLINSNNPENSPEDSLEEMKKKAEEQEYQFPYLKDSNQSVCKAYGASRNPQAFILKHTKSNFVIAYIGAIDDNVVDSKLVGQKYLEDALRSIEIGETAENSQVNAVGCSIK